MHIVYFSFFYRRSSLTRHRFPTQVQDRLSNVIPMGHSIRGHLQKQLLGSRTFMSCLQGLLLHVHWHNFSSNWKRFLHLGATFVGSHTHWHLTGSHRKLNGQGAFCRLHWQLQCSLEYSWVLLSQSVGLTLHWQEQLLWLVIRTVVNSFEMSPSSSLADDQATLLTTRFRSFIAFKGKQGNDIDCQSLYVQMSYTVGVGQSIGKS